MSASPFWLVLADQPERCGVCLGTTMTTGPVPEDAPDDVTEQVICAECGAHRGWVV